MLTARRTYAQNEISYLNALAELRQALVEIEGLLLTGGLEDPGDLAADLIGSEEREPLTGTPKSGLN